MRDPIVAIECVTAVVVVVVVVVHVVGGHIPQQGFHITDGC